MKTLTTEIILKNGDRKTVNVDVDEKLAEWLMEQPKDVLTDFLLFEYRNQCIERKETRHSQSLEASMDNGFDIADENADFVRNYIYDQNVQRLWKAISQLKPEQQWLIREIYFKKRSQAEIAKELGIGESAIRSRLSKIFKKMKKIL